MDRRGFLTLIGGAAALGAGGKILFETVAKADIEASAGSATGAKRWAMAIDLRELEANNTIKNCMRACNEAHNIPIINDSRHEIKWLWKENFHHAFIEQENEHLPDKVKSLPVLLLCNHCGNPPCVNVCPTQATWRRDDGIIQMDWHRCIGCRYCIAACPYGSRSFNFVEPKEKIPNITKNFPARTRGVVEKCTFCSELIVNGEYTRPPYCVSAALGAIHFGNLNDKDSDVYQVLMSSYSIRRKPELGTSPEVYYILSEGV
jgi:molybdopterin-containing oxidoreductase family iron-sulfur binding subunit